MADRNIKNLSSREALTQLWKSLPESERKRLESMIGSMPSRSNMIRSLIQLSAEHLQSSFGQKHRVAIVGPANVGKSTLYNQFIHTKTDRAKVGPIPGTTRENQEFDIGLFAVIDTPGADAVGDLGEQEQRKAYGAARGSDFLIIMFDAIQGIKKTELELFLYLKSLQIPFITVLNKIDLVKKELLDVIDQTAVNLGIESRDIIPISAKQGENLRQVIAAIAMSEPSLVVALGQALPAYRWQLAWHSIMNAASISAIIGLTPLPVIDFAPLVITQSVMVLGIARIYEYKITLSRARELVITFGFGFLGRSLFYELSKFGGLPGWMLAAAIASSTTVVMGYAAALWFERGERLSRDKLGKITQQMTQYMLESIKSFGKHKPGRKTLRKRIEETLEEAPFREDPSLIEKKFSDETNS